MKQKALSLIVIGFLSSPWKAHSISNTAWVETAVDKISSPNVTNSFQLQRTYHSQSLFRGLLGFGWCLEFDKVLKVQPNGDLLYESCEFDFSVRFRLSHEQDNTYIYAHAYPDQYQLTQTQGLYTLTDLPGGHRWVFNKHGELVEWKKSREPKRQLLRDRRGLLQTLVWSPHVNIKVQQDPLSRFITRLTIADQAIHFSYQEDLLTFVKDSFTHWTYRYDTLANLTSSKNADGLEKKIEYDPDTDQLKSLEVAQHKIQLNSFGQMIAIRSPQGRWIELTYLPNGELNLIQIQKTQFDLTTFQQLPSDHPTRIAIETSLRVASFSQIHIARN